MMAENAVLLDISEGIATITLNRPDRLNALSDDVKAGLVESLDTIQTRDDVRCIVLEGNGRAFTAGGDVKSQGDRLADPPSTQERIDRIIQDCEEIPIRLFEHRLPTVAKINGYCVGAGMGLAFACDLHLASDQAKFGLVFRNVGLSLDFGTSFLIPRLVGPSVAKKLALTGEIIDAEEALDIGLISEVFPAETFQEDTGDLIETIANGPTVANSHSMRNIDRGLDGWIDEAVVREATAQGVAVGTDDHEEGVNAFAEDREPAFKGQ